MNSIKIDPERISGVINRNIFGGFAEHLGRCIYGGIYDPDSPLADSSGLRTDVITSLHRLHLPLIRYPGGNFASGYRWRDGIGPLADRPSRLDLAWQHVDSNYFGTNEFIGFCRKLNSEPYLVVNCGDGDLREARDWVEYCNGVEDSALVKMRREHGYIQPHRVKYWGIGNEVDGSWQTGFKTAQEYSRICKEFAKVMKWVDPGIQLIASAVSLWEGDFIERIWLLMEGAGDLVDYLALHWYVGNPENDFAAYMAISELLEKRLTAIEGLIQAFDLQKHLNHPVHLAIDEWNVWYRTHPRYGSQPAITGLEEIYNLEDALVAAIQFNSFIRHARFVKMANMAQIVNVIAPIVTRKNSLVLQTIFYPFELYSSTCGKYALDLFYDGDTFDGGGYSGLRNLDVTATLDTAQKQLVLYVVNRSQTAEMETSIQLISGYFTGGFKIYTINGKDIKTENTFESPFEVITREDALEASGKVIKYAFEPHSVTALISNIY